MPVCTLHLLELEGQRFNALNGGPKYKFNEAISFFISVETQEEVDHFWNRLIADGGEESKCGWLKDKFGLSWQVVPTALGHYLSDPRSQKGRSRHAGHDEDAKDRYRGPRQGICEAAYISNAGSGSADTASPETSFSQGAEWKALISKYIGTIPLSGDALAIEHNASADPPPRTQVSSAMIAKVGAAARYRKSAAPIADPLPFSQRIAPEPRVPV